MNDLCTFVPGKPFRDLFRTTMFVKLMFIKMTPRATEQNGSEG